MVANSGTHELRFYDAAGSHLLSVGREGDGPAEFRQIGGLTRTASDSLAMWDVRLKRLSVFDPNGDLRRTVLPRPAPPGEFPPAEGVFDDGSFLLMSGLNFTSIFTRGTGPRRDRRPLIRYSREGELIDTLAVVPGNDNFAWVAKDAFSLRPLPFGRRTFVEVRGQKVFVASGDSYEITIYAANGARELVTRREHSEWPVTQNDIAPTAQRN